MNANTSEPPAGEQTRGRGADTSLGARLRGAREARGLSLRELSDQTRISRRHLEAIEADDYQQLPGGIFNRSFVKAYARAVGLDEAEAVGLYEQAVRARGLAADDTPALRRPSRIYTDDAPARPPLVTALLSFIILAIISLGAYAALHYYRRTSEPRPPSADAAHPGVGTNTAANEAQKAGGPAAPAPKGAGAPQPAPAEGLSVRVRARGQEVWLGARVDDEQSQDGILRPDEVKEFSPKSNLKLRYAKIKAPALEVTINGRPAAVPTDGKGKNLVEMLITKDDYARLLQQP